LVVEVAGSTLANDLGDKAARYAAEGVEEYWVAEVGDDPDEYPRPRRLHVHRDPIGRHWQSRVILGPDDVVTPRCLPELELKIADLLPVYPVT
jgi:Uma2 family endonuclease